MHLPQISKHFRSIGTKRANAYFRATKKAITGLEKLLKQKIIINYSINPTILGGLIIEYGSTRIDDSLKGKLSRLEQVMKGSV